MNDISMFDIIGPNMIGPSSSHTAGALRIAHLAGKLAPEKNPFRNIYPLWFFCMDLSGPWHGQGAGRRHSRFSPG